MNSYLSNYRHLKGLQLIICLIHCLTFCTLQDLEVTLCLVHTFAVIFVGCTNYRLNHVCFGSALIIHAILTIVNYRCRPFVCIGLLEFTVYLAVSMIFLEVLFICYCFSILRFIQEEDHVKGLSFSQPLKTVLFWWGGSALGSYLELVLCRSINQLVNQINQISIVPKWSEWMTVPSSEN